MTTLALYTPGVLRPPVIDIFNAVGEEYEGVGDVVLWDRTVDPTVPVLCLGEVPEPPPLRYVKTLSQNQILAFPSAVTELTAAIDKLLKPFELRKFDYILLEPKNRTKLEHLLGDVVVVDIETGGDIDVMLPEEMWLLSVALYDGVNNVVLSEEWLRWKKQELIDFLLKPKRKLVAHNMKFDFRSLSAQLGAKIYGNMCTQLLHHSINPGAKEHGLKALCAKYLGADDWDKPAKKYVSGVYKDKAQPAAVYYPKHVWLKYFEKHKKIKVGFENIPREVLYLYNAYDVYWTWHLMEYLLQFADEDVTRVALHEYRMSNFFQDVESGGLAVDLGWLEELGGELLIEKDKYLAELKAMTWAEFNPNSPQQVKALLYDWGYQVKGTGVGIIEDLVKSGKLPEKHVAFCELLLKFRGVAKLHGTYIKGFTKRLQGNKVYTTYQVSGTSTGRLSSTDPNVQNIPRDPRLRRLFTVDDPETQDFLEVDYSQAELRVMAVLSQDDYLISLFQPGMPDFFDSLLPVTFPNADIDSWTKDERKQNRAKLKGVVYGLSYGRKAKAIAHELEMSVHEAQQIISNYFKAAPKFAKWRVMIEDMALTPMDVIKTVMGRRYQAEIVTMSNRQSILNSALAFTPQSTASDICVLAAIEIHKWIHTYDARIIMSVHDAINVQVPKVHTREVARRMQLEMESAARRIFGDQVPFATEAEWGNSWGTAKNPDKKED